MFTQADQHGLVQLLPDTSGIPVAQAPPASHAAAVSKGLGKVFPWNACLQHKQDAVEGGFIADCELARTAFGRRHEGWDQGLQLSPQFVACGTSCHEGSEHHCSVVASGQVVLATLRSTAVPAQGSQAFGKTSLLPLGALVATPGRIQVCANEALRCQARPAQG